jgi:hypothetical protein
VFGTFFGDYAARYLLIAYATFLTSQSFEHDPTQLFISVKKIR